jgi:chromosome segregation protein
VERDSIDAEAARAAEAVTSLEARIAQLTRDLDRETALNADAGDTIATLEQEAGTLRDAMEGHAEALETANAAAIAANDVLGEREGALARETELQADLSARHQAADRRIAEARQAQQRHEQEAEKATLAARDGVDRLASLSRDVEAAAQALQDATDLAGRAEATLAETEQARSEAEQQEAETRSARAEAEGRAATLTSEVTSLTRLLEREAATERAIVDDMSVTSGYEAALGAALADDLNARRNRQGRARAAGPCCPVTTRPRPCRRGPNLSPVSSTRRPSCRDGSRRSAWCQPRTAPASGAASAGSAPRQPRGRSLALGRVLGGRGRCRIDGRAAS